MLARIPRQCVLVATIATINAGVWAVTTPSFQVPDEYAHAGYVEWLVESGTLPSKTSYWVGAPDAQAAASGIPWSVFGHPTWSKQQNDALQRQLSTGLGRRGPRGAGVVWGYPPLYYALEAIPYGVFHGATYFTRLLAMRLFSALFAGLTVAAIFLFARELLPRHPWSWTVGALVVAFQPVLSFMSGGVNNDDLLYAEGALLFWLAARVLRQGLTVRRAVAIGIVVAAGVLTKASIFGLLPGVALALLFALAPMSRSIPRAGRLRVATALALFAGTLYGAYRLLGNRPLTPATVSLRGSHYYSFGQIRQQLSYFWQFWLPRLPFMKAQFPVFPLRQTVLREFVGSFGQLSFGFPGWVYTAAVWIFGTIAALAVATLVRARHILRTRWRELVCYGAMALGFVFGIAVAGYRIKHKSGMDFEQARYFLPLLALYGGVIALAVRGAGQKLARPLGTALVMIAMAHWLFALVLNIHHYYAV